MRIFPVILLLGLAHPAIAQDAKSAEEEEIVVTGIRDGATVVEVDFDKVWRRCAECKRALAKLDGLAKSYRDELNTALIMTTSPPSPNGDRATGLMTFQRSSAVDVDKQQGPRSMQSLSNGLEKERIQASKVATFRELHRRYVQPEQARLMQHMRSFLDQLAPHVVAATEQERKARGVRASLIGKRGTKISAKRLVRIDVTDAVIKRLDAKDFTIDLPNPPAKEARK